MGVNYQSYATRFYRKRYPEVDDKVMVNVRHIAEMGAYVTLIEYEHLEGMVMLSELSRRRIRSINKLIKVGKREAVLVIRVDKDKSYIDLSKRRVSYEEVVACENNFIRAKTVLSILANSAEKLGIPPGAQYEQFLDRTAWTLDEIYKNVGGAYEAFKHSLTDENVLKKCDITSDEMKVISTQIRIRLEPKKVKLRSDIEVACYKLEGIEAVKCALKEGLKVNEDNAIETKSDSTGNEEKHDDNDASNDDEDDEGTNIIQINLIAPPIYMITLSTLEPQKGLATMKKALDAIESKIKEYDGHFKVNMAPKVVSEFDDAELSRKMADLERINAEVDGDDETDESGEDEDSTDDEESSTDIPVASNDHYSEQVEAED